MGRRKRVFTNEFKRAAVLEVEKRGCTVREVAQSLGIGFSTLTRWVSKAREAEARGDVPFAAAAAEGAGKRKSGSPRNSSASSDAAREIARLERRIAELEEERVILKKATAFFAREGLTPPDATNAAG